METNIRALRDISHCVYCGETRGLQRDHVIPTCYLRQKRRYEGDWLVPACGECNRTLGSELIFNVPDRALWVLTAYEKKYSKLIRSVQWHEDDIKELGHSLQTLIRDTAKERASVVRRMEHLRLVSGQHVLYMAEGRPMIDQRLEDVPEFIDDDLKDRRETRRALIRRARVKYRHTEME